MNNNNTHAARLRTMTTWEIEEGIWTLENELIPRYNLEDRDASELEAALNAGYDELERRNVR